MANIEALSRKLNEKKDELLRDLGRRKSDARAVGEPEVRDDGDFAQASHATAEAMQEITLESRTLEQIEDALKRMDEGTYGFCVRCNRPIPEARLEAVPWTPYCLEHAPK